MAVRHIRLWRVVHELVDRVRIDTSTERDRSARRVAIAAKRVSTYGGP